MGDRSSDASALLVMEGFIVLAQSEEDGEVRVLRRYDGRRVRLSELRREGDWARAQRRPGLRTARPAADRCAWCGASAGGSAPTPTATPRASWSRSRPSKGPSRAGWPRRSAAESAKTATQSPRWHETSG
jgi:hypothetical protein